MTDNTDTKPRIFVTGAGGFVGRALMSELSARGLDATGVVRPGKTAPSGQTLHADLAQKPPVLPRASPQDTLVHLAAKAHDRNATQDDFQTGTVGVAENVALAARRAGFTRIVSVSSIGARVAAEKRKEARAYGHAKLAAEAAMNSLRNEDTSVVTIRPPVIYGAGAPGNFGVLQKLIARGVPLPIAFARAERSYLSVENFADFLCTLCVASDELFRKLDGKFLEPADGKPISTRDLARKIGEISGKPVRSLPVPLPLLKLLGMLLGRSDQVSGAIAPLVVENDPETQRPLNWSPLHDFDTGLQRMYTAKID